MKVFLTGGTGFLGSHVLRDLLQHGYEVVALVFEKDREPWLRAMGAQTVVGGFDDHAFLVKAMQGCQGLFHVAGYVSLHDKTGEISRKVNVEGTRKIFEAAREAGVKRAIHTSSIVTIGYSPGGKIMTEADPWNLQDMKFAYVYTKREGEQVAFSYRQKGMEVISVHPGGMIGPEDYFKSEASRMFEEYIKGRLSFADVEVRNNWVDVRDVAAGQRLAFEKGRDGERYNLVNFNGSGTDLVKMINKHAKLGEPKFTIKYPWSKVLGFFMQLFSKKALMTPDIAEFLRPIYWFSHEKAKKELGYNPRPFEQSVIEAFSWYKNYFVDTPAEQRKLPGMK